jgi:hypothetical protein
VEVIAARPTRSRISIANFGGEQKTQASFGTEAAALTLLYGLVAFGQIVLRRVDGYEQLPGFLTKECFQAA